jgi:hypothetical protein
MDALFMIKKKKEREHITILLEFVILKFVNLNLKLT